MQRFLILTLAGLMLSLGGCRKEERVGGFATQSAPANSDSTKLRALGYIGGSGEGAAPAPSAQPAKPAPPPPGKQAPAICNWR